MHSQTEIVYFRPSNRLYPERGGQGGEYGTSLLFTDMQRIPVRTSDKLHRFLKVEGAD